MFINESKELRLKCGCKVHEISAEVEWEEFNGKVHSSCTLAFWQLGRFDHKWSWTHRFKMIFSILKHGHCHSDMVYLDREERRKMYEFFKDVVETDDKLDVIF